MGRAVRTTAAHEHGPHQGLTRESKNVLGCGSPGPRPPARTSRQRLGASRHQMRARGARRHLHPSLEGVGEVRKRAQSSARRVLQRRGLSNTPTIQKGPRGRGAAPHLGTEPHPVRSGGGDGARSLSAGHVSTGYSMRPRHRPHPRLFHQPKCPGKVQRRHTTSPWPVALQCARCYPAPISAP